MGSFTLADLHDSLKELESSFLSTEKDGDLDMTAKVTDLSQKMGLLPHSQFSDHSVVDNILHAAHRVQVLASTSLELERTFRSLLTLTAHQAASILEGANTVYKEPSSYDLSETLPAYHMRKHFLATLDNPYPSQDDKEALVRIINETADRTDPAPSGRNYFQSNQLTLWFINARRRSGWSSILRKFARNDRSRMKLLVQTKMLSSNLPISKDPLPSIRKHKVDDVLRDNLGRLTPEDKKEFEDDWASMISWIRYGVKEKVGDWVYDLVAVKKKPVKPAQGRAVTTAANRSPARKTAKAQTKPRKSKQRPSKTPSLGSNTATSGLESTPELSMCSTADTSFSSLNCNLSMLHYDPFQHKNELLQSPSLRPKGGRKVKALPRRAQKMSSDSLYTSKFFPFFSLSLLGYRN